MEYEDTEAISIHWTSNDMLPPDCFSPGKRDMFGTIEIAPEDPNEWIGFKVFQIGKIEVQIYDPEAVRISPNQTLWESFDTSINTINYGEILVEPWQNGIRFDVIEMYGVPYIETVMVINEIVISETWRGKGLGKALLQGLVELYAGRIGIFILKSCPLQLSSPYNEPGNKEYIKYGLGSLEKDHDKANEKLRRFYDDCGFSRVPDSLIPGNNRDNEDYFIHVVNELEPI